MSAICSTFICQRAVKGWIIANCIAQIHAWTEYKRFRNMINNRKKSEEKCYKSNKMAEVADKPELVWKRAKSFMGWKSLGIPTQLMVGNVLFTSPKKIAQHINEFFSQQG